MADVGRLPGGANHIVRAHTMMLAFAFLVSTSITVGEATTHALDPAALTFLRFLLTAVILAVVLIVEGSPLAIPSIPDLASYCWLGFLCVMFFVTMFEALRLTSALNVGVIYTLVPPLTALMSWLGLGQRMKSGQVLALMIAGLAAVWVVFDANIEKLLRFSIGRGEVIFFVGCIAYAAYSPSVRKLRGARSLTELTFWTAV
ncbi:MAG: DMT family transporter, partial [Hyphomicrobiaceae bacterium]